MKGGWIGQMVEKQKVGDVKGKTSERKVKEKMHAL